MTDRHSAHPSDEILAAYLSTGLSAAERRDIGQHLHTCDRCVQAVAVAHHRIGMAHEIAAPVPQAVRERARTPELSVPGGGNTRPNWLSVMRDRLSGVLRLPVLAPVALAAGLVLVVATSSTWLRPHGDLTRSIQLHQNLRVTTTEAPVRNQPSTRAEVVATLRHGNAVEIRDEQHDWYRVALPDGTEGWVLRQAFE
jgi:anti-sigma factor RsiW